MISIVKRPPRGQTLLGRRRPRSSPAIAPRGRAFAEIQFQIATSHSSHMTHMGHRAGEAVCEASPSSRISRRAGCSPVGKILGENVAL
jgi:hypothetical protein